MLKIALDAHKRYSFISVEDKPGRVIFEDKIYHLKGAIRGSLGAFASDASVAVEAMGSWYWIIDEIEMAGLKPKLVHPRKAKVMLGCINKTDKLDARGLNRLQWAGTLPSVWIPDGDLRDKRSLSRTRMYLVHQRTSLKCRVHAALAAYGINIDEISDIFGKAGRKVLDRRLAELPPQTAFTTNLQLKHIELYDANIKDLDRRIEEVFKPTESVKLLDSLPGVGLCLAMTIELETGDIERFASSEKFASYSGTTPRVHASGGKVHYGRLRPDVNRYLKWAFVEAANAICLNQKIWSERHVVKLYKRVKASKGSGKAIGAVARHLAEATYWILEKGEPYKDPALKGRSNLSVGQ